jgi:hypothetical protein
MNVAFFPNVRLYFFGFLMAILMAHPKSDLLASMMLASVFTWFVLHGRYLFTRFTKDFQLMKKDIVSLFE